MNRTELTKFRIILSAKHAELARAAAKREGIAIERSPDELDETVFAAERELTTRSLELNLGLLRKVDAALGRISDGTYGTCLECEEEISQKRLNAMPWATLCIACQEQADGSRFLKAA
jgi:DnaK suppressor protein